MRFFESVFIGALLELKEALGRAAGDPCDRPRLPVRTV